MELISGIVGLAMLAFVICVACYCAFTAVLGMIEIYEVLCYPFVRLRCFVAGADDRFAPLGRLFLAALVSKLTAALIVATIALLLGASAKPTAIAAALACFLLG